MDRKHAVNIAWMIARGNRVPDDTEIALRAIAVLKQVPRCNQHVSLRAMARILQANPRLSELVGADIRKEIHEVWEHVRPPSFNRLWPNPLAYEEALAGTRNPEAGLVAGPDRPDLQYPETNQAPEKGAKKGPIMANETGLKNMLSGVTTAATEGAKSGGSYLIGRELKDIVLEMLGGHADFVRMGTEEMQVAVAALIVRGMAETGLVKPELMTALSERAINAAVVRMVSNIKPDIMGRLRTLAERSEGAASQTPKPEVCITAPE
jgi:hypothetical protein